MEKASDPWAPGWSDGMSATELLRRAQVYRDIAATPGIWPQDRNAAERMVARYEEAARLPRLQGNKS